MGSRRHKRTPLRSQVRIFGMDRKRNPFTRLAETIDVSPVSVRLSGIFVEMHPDEEVDLEFDGRIAHFRIAWQGKIGTPHAGELALYAANPTVVLWPTDDPEWKDSFDTVAAASERRFYRRFECELIAYITPEGETTPALARCVELSFGGCYFQTPHPLPAGTRLSLSMHNVLNASMQADGIVAGSHAGFGMGVTFTRVDDPKSLAALLESVRKSQVRADSSAIMPPSTEPAMFAVEDRSAQTILVVDDSLATRNIAAHHLRQHGYSVIAARDGEEALSILRTSHPDLILLDILMPKLSGLAVLRRLKAHPSTCDIPVLVMSGLSEENDARMLAEGACGYVAKANIHPKQLPRIVANILQHAHVASPARN